MSTHDAVLHAATMKCAELGLQLCDVTSRQFDVHVQVLAGTQAELSALCTYLRNEIVPVGIYLTVDANIVRAAPQKALQSDAFQAGALAMREAIRTAAYDAVQRGDPPLSSFRIGEVSLPKPEKEPSR